MKPIDISKTFLFATLLSALIAMGPFPASAGIPGELPPTDHCETLLTGFANFSWKFTAEQKAYYQKLKADNDPNLRYFLNDILMRTATETDSETTVGRNTNGRISKRPT